MSLFHESKWSDSDVETIISLIKAHPLLWNSNCKDYKDVNARNAAFNAIAEKINKFPAEEVRKKYRNLRTQYVREVRLIKQRGYGTGWIFYEALKFLSTGQVNRQDAWEALLSEDTEDYKEQIPSSIKVRTNTNNDSNEDEIEQYPEYTEDYLEDCVSLNDDSIYRNDGNDSQPTHSKCLRLESETNENNFDSKRKKRRPTVLIMKQPQLVRDEHAVLGEQVANELRALQNQPALQQSLKCAILQAILEVNKALSI